MKETGREADGGVSMRDEGKGGASRIALRVRYAETDQMGVVYYANYPVWFEVGRAGFLRDRGLAYADLEREGFRLPVSGVRYRLLAPARYDEELTVETAVAALRSRAVTFTYRILRDGKVLARGETDHVCVDRGMRPIRLPEKLRRALGGEEARAER